MDWTAEPRNSGNGMVVRVNLLDGVVIDVHPDIAMSFGKSLVKAAEVSTCEHDWVDARNKHVQSGEMCTKCHAIRPSQIQE